MVQVTDELALSLEHLSLYYTHDPHLSNLPVLIYHGPSTTTNSTLNSSRIQLHIFTAAGFQTYQRITISPNSPLYQSVNYLPRDKQGDEVCRGLAFGLFKYFKELPEVVKSGLILQVANTSRKQRPGSAPKLFGEQHAADLASSMVRVENVAEVTADIEAALRIQNINYVDMDLVLPPGSISPLQESEEDLDEEEYPDLTLKQYGSYASLVKLFGEVTFLPTSRIRRAPSRPTSLNRSRSFLKDQKLALRREMGELVDTEERYVIKMHELVNHIADDFRAKAKSRAFGSFSPSEDDLQKLFPRCLDRILQINSAFLSAIRKVMDETEEEAMQDLEAPVVSSTSSRYGGSGRLKDPTGALAFAKVLLEWFPQFSESYQQYIHASQEFPQIISSFMKQPSSFSSRVQATGEQRLRSAVIEPVQRLPRYSLFIDNIVNSLPILHPALQPMLKARDIITSICSLDPPATDKSQVVNRLRCLVDAWPSTLHPQGRLITAVDTIELPAPYHFCTTPGHGAGSPKEGILLLFADCIVLLKKNKDCLQTARGVMAEIDKPSAQTMMASVTAAAGGQKHIFDLSFTGWHVLGDTKFTSSDDNRCIWLTSLHELRDANMGRNRNQAATVRNFVLQGAYEAKASRLGEELIKARLEGRFSEAERESDKWSLRSMKPAGVCLYTAVFAEGVDNLIQGRREPAPVRLVVDHEKGTKGAPVGHYGVDIVANVTTLAGGEKYRLEIDGLNDRVYVDEVLPEYFMMTFAKRVTDLLRLQHQISNPSLSAPFTSFYTKILKSIDVLCEGDKSKSYRPHSPVKMLSSLLNSGFGSSASPSPTNVNGFASPNKISRPIMMGKIPSLESPQIVRTSSNRSLHSIQDLDGKGGVRATFEDSRPINPLVRLEETFTGYIAALQSRKGNVVGKNLRTRGATDELAVNALYNTFIENPFDTRAASETSFDVIFVAFEKFLRLAWKEQMGSVMSLESLDALQERSINLYPGDFNEYVRLIFGEMAPQNRRAFIAIIKLLADLLDGCGNDGDRGSLTVAFAELLVVDGEPHNYINLLDRVVEDSDRLFDDLGPGAGIGSGGGGGGGGGSNYGSVASRSIHSATGSITSNTSLRRRFADTVFRQSSTKSDTDHRPSVWRTLSKTTRSVATGDQYASKPSLGRAHSIESPDRKARPGSRDRPTVMGAFDDRPGSSDSIAPKSRLSTIGASPPPEDQDDNGTTRSSKKKRRSSLSDLKSLMAQAAVGPMTPSPEQQPATTTPPNKLNSPPRTPSPIKVPASPMKIAKLPVNGSIMDRDRSLMYRNSPALKENTPITSPDRSVGNLTERAQNIMSSLDSTPVASPIKEQWRAGHNKTVSLSSNIPTLRGTPRDPSRPINSSANNLNGIKSPQRLRLQSPQKLRERLQNEAKAINEAEASLQNELSKIGEEMAKLNAVSAIPRTSDIARLSEAVLLLETKIPNVVKELNERNDAVKKELETSLQASEFKVRALDQLYKESSAENELLYEKFNAELGKIVKALRTSKKTVNGAGGEDGNGVNGAMSAKEELVTRMRESSEEAARVKKENARLRREVLTLRTLLKGQEAVGPQ
ncbi:hypothetical protein sscle_10g080080 [Sclerotinia sclerotiorum 1980 UF-70]|uniref:DH domain-containing protein n=1 Tax=Sclerotinia sclerotiorum (strain ATCC 18683 / 1980 / Ss-1) TaxID=665079 RepID=A0A1D9QEC4_SCLS1|nr:hypothetical protein sscle_10g080080 [Sclerotinia sclerotiorum 1980 UF-70]